MSEALFLVAVGGEVLAQVGELTVRVAVEVQVDVGVDAAAAALKANELADWGRAAQTIMTTDTVAKAAADRAEADRLAKQREDEEAPPAHEHEEQIDRIDRVRRPRSSPCSPPPTSRSSTRW